MLKYRVLTALILIPLFVALVIKLPPIGFCILTGIFVLLGAWEWSFFMGVKKLSLSLIYPVIILLLLGASLELPLLNILYISVVWWLVAFSLVVSYPKTSQLWAKSVLLRALMGVMVLIPCWLAVNFIRNAENGVYILLFLFVLIWGADIGAYFSGRKWGKHKLAPSVSPGKTWEGMAGALVVTCIIVSCAIYYQQLPPITWFSAFVLTISTVLFSILGDLFESMLKRNVGLKDSGRLLPGHGGILDRIDSLTAAAPVFAVGASLIGNYYQ